MRLEGLMMTKHKFTKIIEDKIRYENMYYIDAVLDFCDDNNLDADEIKKYVSEPIKNKIEAEARKLNYFPRVNTLPFGEDDIDDD